MSISGYEFLPIVQIKSKNDIISYAEVQGSFSPDELRLCYGENRDSFTAFTNAREFLYREMSCAGSLRPWQSRSRPLTKGVNSGYNPLGCMERRNAICRLWNR